MNLEQFEKKVAEWIEENDTELKIIPTIVRDSSDYTWFTVSLFGAYKDKQLRFVTAGEKDNIEVYVRGTDWSDIFDQAFRMIKARIRNTRTRKESKEEGE